MTSSGSWLLSFFWLGFWFWFFFFGGQKADQADPHSLMLIKQATQMFMMVSLGLELWFLCFMLPNLSIAKSQNQLGKKLRFSAEGGEVKQKIWSCFNNFSSLCIYIFILVFQGMLIIIYMKKRWQHVQRKGMVLLHKHKRIIHLKALYISVHDFIDF